MNHRLYKPLSLFLLGVTLVFSYALMQHTFSYNETTHELEIATKAWSDFGAHIPLIRSFSKGENGQRLLLGKPIESPLFPGEPIRYHFGFYAVAGLLEKAGLPIDLSLNIPSALGLSLLLVAVYSFSLLLFAEQSTAILSVVFVLFNGSLSFLRFFATHTVADILTNTKFPAFGPWDGNPITAFWTLNIYTNQRHLAFSYALILLTLIALKTTRGRILSLIIAGTGSLLFFFNFPAASILFLFLGTYFLTVPKTRTAIVYGTLLTIPSFLLLSRYAHMETAITWHPGYLATGDILWFWIENIGLHSILIPVGFLLSPAPVRRILLGPLAALFILPNCFQLSTDMINNHKFFNFFLIIGGMLSAHTITVIAKKRFAGIFVSGVLVILLTLSGVIDLFPILNDQKGSIQDEPTNGTVSYIETHTAPSDVIANSTWFYHPASLAGRALFSGYTYFTWSYGYNQTAREATLQRMYQAPTRQELCALLTASHIAAIELSPRPESYLHVRTDLFSAIPADYTNPSTGDTIRMTTSICHEYRE